MKKHININIELTKNKDLLKINKDLIITNSIKYKTL